MSLIERYLHEVERNLPRRLRADVSRELRSSIEDSVDARATDGPGGRDAAVLGVLCEYGPPAEIARSYLPQRYIIGPRFYDAFWATIKITFLIVAGLIALGLTADLITDDTSVREALWLIVETVGEFPGTAVMLLGIITVVFIVIDRVSASGGVGEESAETWDPTALPEVEDTSRINRVSHAVDACLYVGLFVFFNFFREYIGIFNHTNGEWWFMPLSGPGFGSHLLWLNLWWSASLATTVVVLRTGRWFPWTRAAKLILAALLAVILFRMAFDPDIIGLPADWPAGYPDVDPDQQGMAEFTAPVVAWLTRVGLGIACVVVVWGVVRQAIRSVTDWVRP
jgi:hypothetical protein